MNILVWIEKCSKWLFILACIGLLLIIIVQGLLQIDELRHFLVPVEQWEGKRLSFA